MRLTLAVLVITGSTAHLALFADSTSDVPSPALPTETASVAAAAASKPLSLIEMYPPIIYKRFAGDRTTRHIEAVRMLSLGDVEQQQLFKVVAKQKLWKQGDTVRVAFREGMGSLELRQSIEALAMKWLGEADENRGVPVKLSFKNGDKYREWGENDSSYEGDIRIGFEEGKYGGYWSMVGTDAIVPAYCHPNEPSMNLQGFAQFASLDGDQTAIILHEFGHALGFEHEHQHPDANCEAAIRWESVRDSNGNVLKGAYDYFYEEYGWSESDVLYNLQTLPREGYTLFRYDPASIMMYVLPKEIFLDLSDPGRCYLPNDKRAQALSGDDLTTARQAYEVSDKERGLLDLFNRQMHKRIEHRLMP